MSLVIIHGLGPGVELIRYNHQIIHSAQSILAHTLTLKICLGDKHEVQKWLCLLMRNRQEVAGRLQTPSAGGISLPKASVQVSADTPPLLPSCIAFEGFPKGYGSDFGESMPDLGENDHLGETLLSLPAGSTVAHSRS